MINLKHLSKDSWNELDRYLIDISRESSLKMGVNLSIVEDRSSDKFDIKKINFVDGSRKIYKEYNSLVDDKYFCFGAFGAINAGIIDVETKDISFKQENIFTFPDIEEIDGIHHTISGQKIRSIQHDSGTSSREGCKKIINDEMLLLEESIVEANLSTDKTIIMDGRARVKSVPSEGKWCFGHVKSFQSMPPVEIILELKKLNHGDMSSVFLVNKNTYRWYFKHTLIPRMESQSPFSYVSRMEVTSDEDILNINEIAKKMTKVMLQYSSSPKISSRWPQNPHPIEFLEKRLKAFFISNNIMELSLP